MVKYISPEDRRGLSEAIAAAERGTSGEIRVHVHTHSREDMLEHAKKIFKKLGMHKTKHRNGVLIVADPKNKRFAILGDAGIYEKTGEDFWNSTRDAMAEHFRKNEFKLGLLEGIHSAGEKLKKYFPADGNDPNELSDEVTQE